MTIFFHNYVVASGATYIIFYRALQFAYFFIKVAWLSFIQRLLTIFFEKIGNAKASERQWLIF